MTRYWIVVADAGRALVLSRTGNEGALSVEHEMTNPLARKHISELVTDHQGRVEKNGMHMKSAMEPHTDQHEQQAVKFARDLCKFVDQAVNRRAFDSLVLIAPSHFLGLLQAKLGKVSRRRLAWSQPRDLIHASLDELGEYITGTVYTAMAVK